MIFALIDYLHYRRRSGVYSDEHPDNQFAVAFSDEIPADVVSKLEVGDMIFTQRLDSLFSWGTMYFASAPVDHVAVYEEDGKVVHFTLKGAKRLSLAKLAKGARILPLRFGVPRDFADESLGPGADGGYLPRKKRLSHALPPKLQLVWVAMLLSAGYFPERFRWKLLADIWITAALADLLLWTGLHVVAALPLAALVTVFALGRQALYQRGKKSKRPYERLSHPDIGYHAFWKRGGYLFTKIGILVAAPGLGLLPLKAFEAIDAQLRLGRERADHGADNQLEGLDQISRDRREGGDVEVGAGDAEQEQEHHDQEKEVKERPDRPRNADKQPKGD